MMLLSGEAPERGRLRLSTFIFRSRAARWNCSYTCTHSRHGWTIIVAEVDRADATRQTILVVKDEVLIRMVIREYLRACGYRIIEAASGHEALERISRSTLYSAISACLG